MSIGGIVGSAVAANPYVSTAKAAGGAASLLAGKADDAVSDFLSWAKMTPAQQMRAKILASLGLKDSDLAAMDPKQRAAVEQKIADQIKQQVQQGVEKKTGVAIDLKV